MAPHASWRCCFRPQVAEGDAVVKRITTPRKGGEVRDVEKDKCTEDSANADLFSRLKCRPVRTDADGMDDADEEFASPASSYQTCFSEQDPMDLSGMSRIYRTSCAVSVAEAPASTSAPVGGAEWLQTDLGRPPAQPRRTRLPDPVQELPGINLWSLIKDWIGKDIHKLALPTHINEPLTDLQRRAEAFENSELLDEAARMPAQSLDRLLQVTTFAISMYNTIKRTQKPFKNLQNSTYELVYPEKGIRCIGEKVRHVPMVHVMHTEGRGWGFDANDEFSMELWGNHAIIRPVGELFVKFHDGDEYCWSTVPTYINNILIGKRSIDHRGSFYVNCLTSGECMKVKIKEPLFGKGHHDVTGHYEQNGKKVEGLSISGKWDVAISVEFPDASSRKLWTAPPTHKHPSTHPFSLWALHLNELTPELKEKLPPTDDRLRADMRLFEHGYYHEANEEKLRLEEKQRQERNATEAAGKPWQARWFEQVPGGRRGFEKWQYKGGYWEARESGKWEGCREIYGPGPKGEAPPEYPL
ncbi:g6066 [Coccomyxa elongata]